VRPPVDRGNTCPSRWVSASVFVGACMTACSGEHDVAVDGGRMAIATVDGAPDLDSTIVAEQHNGVPEASAPGTEVGSQGACSAGTTECLGIGVRVCESDGGWGTVMPCAPATPFCADGNCAAEPPSCKEGGDGVTNCGTSHESCCSSLTVAGGTYNRTYLTTDAGPSGLADPATLSSFRLDKYEVTVGRFRRFVSAWKGGAGFTPPAGSGKHTHLNAGLGLANGGGGTYEPGWIASDDKRIAPTDDNLGMCRAYATWTPSSGTQESLPINCVNWWESYAFCIWDGGFLPSEAEWKYASAGGNQQREYPWGSTDPGTANQYAIYGCCYPSGAASCTDAWCTGVANIAPVGTASMGAGAWGQLDLAGSFWEWNLDFYPDNTAFVDPCTDCAYLTATATRMVKVGNFSEGYYYLPNWLRYDYDPSSREIYLGFRCARAP
jgi:sulfatase modifying factor 1